MKDNAKFHVTKVLVDKTKKKAKGVVKEQHITVEIKDKVKGDRRLKLRRIIFIPDEGKTYIYATNNVHYQHHN
ncbi:MAG TPA: hypothetical protein VFX43_11445 [Chitinophagaceae bacterium]|nr:hypothetical protein [Chitinophagaceae bacterium]